MLGEYRQSARNKHLAEFQLYCSASPAAFHMQISVQNMNHIIQYFVCVHFFQFKFNFYILHAQMYLPKITLQVIFACHINNVCLLFAHLWTERECHIACMFIRMFAFHKAGLDGHLSYYSSLKLFGNMLVWPSQCGSLNRQHYMLENNIIMLLSAYPRAYRHLYRNITNMNA